ncbi:TPA: conjugal transfer protein [Bacillus thuringiensis]|uniref:Conjugal transfer protein n=1 Tax=Bacillus thuringiensis serovar iberica TaxID=180866 RepID=A0A9X6QLY5_BACTU|nr:conjugal transfer protein [Bacillus thuringiensis]MEB9622209.1 conjugal transfer protein [Bacillus cereus]OUB44763.1 conjugal transfer protein [Bacillus thuringiensis serovar iberica]HDR5353732.1 conjugal transfer protein [Bacillus thuringiensis]
MWKKIRNWFQKTKNGKEGEPRKALRVPSYRGRLIGKWLFWGILAWMFFVSCSTVFKTMKADAKVTPQTETKQVVSKQNLATRPEAIEFARLFTKEYFTWKRGEEDLKKRAERLKVYVSKGVDSQAGIETNALQWDSDFLYATILKVDETKENEANVIFKVKYKLHRMKPDNSGEEVKEVWQQVSVPVQTDGKAFVINGLPQIVKINEKATVKEIEDEREEVKDVKIKTEIREFLPTFFKSYTTATQKELAYVLENPNIKGLEGSMKLDKINSSKVYPGKTKGTYEVQAEVLLIDVHSETKMKAAYTLVVKQTGKQFVVTDLQN